MRWRPGSAFPRCRRRETGRSLFPVLGLLALLLVACRGGAGLPGQGGPPEPDGADQTAAPVAGEGPWPTHAFWPPKDAAPWPVSGTLRIDGGEATGVSIRVDSFGLAEDPAYRLTSLPAFSLRLVSDGKHLIPARRGPRPTAHPYWEILVEPGGIGPAEAGAGLARAVLPFGLKESNQNCVHYGLLTFSLGERGAVSDVAWQVASETCAYLKFDAWGRTAAHWQSGDLPEGEALRTAWAAERSERMPVRPVTDLAGAGMDLDLSALAPPAAEDATAWGVVLDGVHYRSDCPTRQGPHPWCDRVPLPSYSTAKSLFAGLVFLRMVRRWPELESVALTELVPECDLPDGRWDGVRLRHVVDMTTGNFHSDAFHADEADERMQAFFLATTNADKLCFSCEAWPRQAPPGTRPVYHSSDDYLLGVALQRFLREQLGSGADIHRDVLLGDLLAPLSPGPLLSYTQRSYDPAAQPFVSYGLFFHPDDVARIGVWLQDDDALGELLTARDLAGIRFRDRSAMQSWALGRGEGYYAGFWGFDVAPFAGCDAPVWVPFMSGYGGIRWALPPGGAVYWFFTDSGHGSWLGALVELGRVSPLCDATIEELP